MVEYFFISHEASKLGQAPVQKPFGGRWLISQSTPITTSTINAPKSQVKNCTCFSWADGSRFLPIALNFIISHCGYDLNYASSIPSSLWHDWTFQAAFRLSDESDFNANDSSTLAQPQIPGHFPDPLFPPPGLPRRVELQITRLKSPPDANFVHF